jgi:hypothetical protein
MIGDDEMRDKTSQRLPDLVRAVVISLLLPTPGGVGFLPNVIALWFFATDEDVGHGGRVFWLTVVLAIVAIYTTVVYAVIRFIRSKFAARRKKSE